MNRKNITMVIIGCIIVLLQFNINIGNVGVDLFHDVLGYVIVLVGIQGLCDINKMFKKVRGYAIGGLLGSIFVQWLNTFDLSADYALATTIRTGIAAFFFIYVTYYFTEGLIEYAKLTNMLSSVRTFQGSWVALAGTYFLYYLALMSGIGNLAFVMNIVMYIAGMYHMMNINNGVKSMEV